MRILITGGAGFIGSHLAERLASQGHKVTVIDRKPYRDWPEPHLYGWSLDCRDIGDGFIKEKWGSVKWGFVYHLAATVGVRRVLEDPKECIENNIESLRAVLSLGIPGIFASTSEVYGKTDEVLSEVSPLIYSSKSRWVYATSKLIGEHLAAAAGWKSVRFFNVVGPRQNRAYGAVLPQFVSQALRGEPLTVYGDGSQVRTFLDVRDCAEILDRLRDKSFDVVNVGGLETLTVHALACKVVEQLTERARLRHVPYPHPEGFEECQRRVPDLTKLHSLIGKFEYRPLSETIQDLAATMKTKEAVTA